MQVTLLTRALTMAGVIPIIGLGLLSLSGQFHWVTPTLGIYLFGIVMFMLGTLWGQAKEEGANLLAITSNSLFLIAFISYTLLDNTLWLFASAGILCITFVAEYIMSDISDDYKKLRTEITLLACTIIVVIALFRLF